MRDHKARLDQLCALRARLVQRCSADAAAANAAFEAAVAAADRAALTCEAEAAALSAAVMKRLAKPDDVLISVFVERCQLNLAQADALRQAADVAVAHAEPRLADARRRWLRASARHDILIGMCRSLGNLHRRAMERQMSDDANERIAVSGFRL